MHPQAHDETPVARDAVGVVRRWSSGAARDIAASCAVSYVNREGHVCEHQWDRVTEMRAFGSSGILLSYSSLV